MSDLPPDLPRLRTLETWLELTLREVRQRIADEERREAERARGAAARSPVPDWVVEGGIGAGPPVYVHIGGCHMAGPRSRGVARDQAVRALVDGVDACPQCRPDSALGVLD
ncbi:DUF6233 domain-containing protein [Streptomyces uncialis]|uniref:DUF6233 domain-containing protein n=1 Tax=Streptomyces uncialis TaxID=1048205 RepID=UPI0037AADC78